MYLILKYPRLTLTCELLLNGIRYSLDDGFFIQKVDLALGRMHIDIYRPRVEVDAARIIIFLSTGRIQSYLKYTKGEEPFGSIPLYILSIDRFIRCDSTRRST